MMIICLCVIFFQIAVIVGFYNVNRVKKNSFYFFISIFFLTGAITGLNNFFKNVLYDKIALASCLTVLYLLSIYVLKQVTKHIHNV